MEDPFLTLKKLFAAELFTGSSPLMAALKVCYRDEELANKLVKFRFDPDVLEEIKNLYAKREEIKLKEESTVDNKEKLLLKLKAMYDNMGIVAKDRVSALKVAAEIQGFVGKDANKGEELSVNKVMLVHKLAGDWEKELQKQQEKLRSGLEDYQGV